LLATCASSDGQEKKGAADAKDAKQPPAPVIHLAPQAEKKPASSLAYRLLPDPLDQVEGNAAPSWLRAMMEARSVRYKWTEQQWNWSDYDKVPLDKLPLKEVKAALLAHATALRRADQAALCTHCDWNRPLPTIQNLSTDLPLGEIQGMREIAHLLALRCRVELAERNYEAALRTLQTGFTLARHVASSLLLEDLVGIAIASIMLSRIEEWVQIPGSPNLYWALTDLPRPLFDMRRSTRIELSTLYRSYPELRELKKKKLTGEQAQRLVAKVLDSFGQCGPEVPGWMKTMGTAVLAIKYYPAAKKALIAGGRTAKEVEAMPKVQVVAIYYLEEYDRTRDEILKWLAVPPWQGLAGLQKVEEDNRKRADEGNMLIRLLMPAIAKVHGAHLRLGRHLAGLRGAEALRRHMATNGQLPAKWADVTIVPGPLDPFTGKGLDEWYKLDGAKAVLDMPPPPRMPPSIGRRFQVTVKAAGGK
jgi:hypothetical protein